MAGRSSVDMTIKEDWRDYILGPKGPLVAPVRVAVVPWDPARMKQSQIKWRKPRDREKLPSGGDTGLLLDFGVKTAGFLSISTDDASDFGIGIQYGPDIRLTIFEDTVHYTSAAGCHTEDKFRPFRFLKVRSVGGDGISAGFRV